MKKLLLFASLFFLIAAAASAQGGVRKFRSGPGFNEGAITRSEKAQLRSDLIRYRVARRHAGRDGFISPRERMRLHQMKNQTRRDAFRYRHNGRRRLI